MNSDLLQSIILAALTAFTPVFGILGTLALNSLRVRIGATATNALIHIIRTAIESGVDAALMDGSAKTQIPTLAVAHAKKSIPGTLAKIGKGANVDAALLNIAKAVLASKVK